MWLRVIALSTAIGFCTSGAYAQQGVQPPDSEHIIGQLSDKIPAYWDVRDLTIVATANEGDEVDPNYKIRFRATVSPSSSLYVTKSGTSDALEPFTPLIKSADTDETRTLYGTTSSTYSAGEWETSLSLENTVSNIGKTRSMFDSPIFIVGSEEEKDIVATLEKLEKQAVANAFAETRAKISDKYQERISGLRAQYREKMTSLEEKMADRLEALREEHSNELEAMQQEYFQKEESLRKKLRKKKGKLRESITDLEKKYKTKKTEYENKLSAAKADFQKKMESLKDKNEERLASLKERLQDKVESVQSEYTEKIEQTKAHIDSLDKLEKLYKERKKKEERVAEARKEATSARRDRIESTLEEFRTSLDSASGDKLKAVLLSAMESNNLVLKETALERALVSSDPPIRKAAIRKALGADGTLRDEALNLALRSTDAGLRQEGMRKLLSEPGRIRVDAWNRRDGGTDELIIEHGSLNSGGVSVSFNGTSGRFDCEANSKANLSNGELVYSGDECAFTLRPDSSGRFIGRFTSTYEWLINSVLPGTPPSGGEDHALAVESDEALASKIAGNRYAVSYIMPALRGMYFDSVEYSFSTDNRAEARVVTEDDTYRSGGSWRVKDRRLCVDWNKEDWLGGCFDAVEYGERLTLAGVPGTPAMQRIFNITPIDG